MPAPSPEIPPPAIYAQAWAIRLGGVLLAAFTVILALAFYDSAHRTELETVSETTAVGDTHFFQPPADATRLPAVGAMLNGQPLYVADLKPVEIRDTRTKRIGTDAERGWSIYELAPTANDAERERVGGKRRAYLLKVGFEQWVIARLVGEK